MRRRLSHLSRSGLDDQKTRFISMSWSSFTLDQLSVEDDLVSRDEWLVFPTVVWPSTSAEIHRSHVRVNGYLRKPKDPVCWPRLSSQMKNLVMYCAMCNVLSQCSTTEITCDIKEDASWSVTVCGGRSINAQRQESSADGGLPQSHLWGRATEFNQHRGSHKTNEISLRQIWNSRSDQIRPGWPTHLSVSFSQTGRRNQRSEELREWLLEEIHTSVLWISEYQVCGTGLSQIQRWSDEQKWTNQPQPTNLSKPSGSASDRCGRNKRWTGRTNANRAELLWYRLAPLKSLEEGDTMWIKLLGLHGEQWEKGTVLRQRSDRFYEVQTSQGNFRCDRGLY